MPPDSARIILSLLGLFQTVATESLPWSEEEIELNYNGQFHTCLLIPLRDYLQKGVKFTVIKTKHLYVLEDPNSQQNEDSKSLSSVKSMFIPQYVFFGSILFGFKG